MILKNQDIANISIESINVLYKLKQFLEYRTLMINKEKKIIVIKNKSITNIKIESVNEMYKLNPFL